VSTRPTCVARLDDERFVRCPQRLLILGIAFLVLFVLAAFLVPHEPLDIEQRWSESMQDIEGSLLTNIAHVFNALGRGIGRAALLAVPGIILLVARRWWALLAFGLTEAVTPLVSSITKALIERPRPPDGLVHPSSTSFPSGHASFAATTSIALVLLFTAIGPRRRLWWALAAVTSAAMDWSRTYLQVHWLLDVVAGSLLGAGVALVVFPGLQLVRAARQLGRPMPSSRESELAQSASS
jgi:undecaprenyl-diphosphatase